jgi:flagellar motility protein MotE (MotC chaperone)
MTHRNSPLIRRVAGPAAALTLLTLMAGAPASTQTVITENGISADVEKFCSNIEDAARDRRYAIQMTELETLRKDVDQRLALLEEKRSEYEDWLKRRNDFLSKAEDGVVAIYATMRPDAAAERLSELKAELAAGILMKLKPKDAGVILNEMNSKAAATLTGIMASAARRQDPS